MNRAAAVFIVRAGLLGLGILLPQSAAAAWPTSPLVNVPLCTAGGTQTNPSIASDGAGGAIVTWQDSRSGDLDIYAQRIASTGEVVWPDSGIVVCTAVGTQGVPTIVEDGAGGAIITWQDLRSAGNTDIYAQRIDADGKPKWAADGVILCAAANEQSNPMIISDNAGGAVVAWLDLRSGSLVNATIQAQRIAANGTVQWATDGVALCLPVSELGSHAIIPDGSGGAFVTWYDGPSGLDSDIFAQWITAAGKRNWTGAGVAVCTAVSRQRYPAIASDDAGGVIVTWEDRRSGLDDDIFAQRIAANGVALWAANGVLLCIESYNQSDPALIPDGSGGAIVIWQDSRWFYADIYAQRIAADGAAQWTANGVAICLGSGDQGSPALVTDDAGGAIATWLDERNLPGEIYAQRISADGLNLWPTNGAPVSTASSLKGSPRLVAMGGGNAIITWQDRRGTSMKVYAQGIDNRGGFFYMPAITGISDLAGDQGGKVRVAWQRSPFDTMPGLEISIYGIWRETSISAMNAALDRGAQLMVENEQGALPQPGVFRATAGVAGTKYWEGVGTVAARGEPTYTFVAPTLQDSSSTGNAYTVFMVDAHLAFQPGFFDSDPDSGYSVDNLAPPQPAAFSGQYLVSATALHWSQSYAPDLAGYQLYRGDTESFVPGPANLVVAKPDTGFVDPVAGNHTYKLCAVDIHGNLSTYAVLTPQQTSPVTGAAPAALRLYPNTPNPFNPLTTIRFDLPTAGAVRLSVYDVAGRLVRTLVDGDLPMGRNEVRWDGRDASGRGVASGSYLARLEFEGRVEAMRMGLVR